MALPNWPAKPETWSNDERKLLLSDTSIELLKPSLKDVIENSEKFPLKFPVDTGRCKTLKHYLTEQILEGNINSAYPVIHENALHLYCKFILYKREHGTAIEKSLYKEITLLEFINRLLKKRAAMFMGKADKYMLISGEKGSKGWEAVGTDNEQSPLLLQNCLSYDEVKMSAFLSVSSYTYFVNIGDRKNMAKFSTDRKGIEDEGVIVGMIGPRFNKDNVMEFQEIVITENQNATENGYGTDVSSSVHKLFSSFYEEPCRNYAEVLDHRKTLPKNNERYVEINTKRIFDNHMYYKRLTISIDTLLMEANHRAAMKGTTAYIHVVGLGLGVWRASAHQEKVYMDAFAKRIALPSFLHEMVVRASNVSKCGLQNNNMPLALPHKSLVNFWADHRDQYKGLLGKNLSCVSDICFAYINQAKCGYFRNRDIFPVEGHPNSGIKIHIYKREPHAKLLNKDAGKLLVVSYAWDGNALPGNEYWSGKLGSSGDSAAASSTQITEIHNPHINPIVEASYLRIVTQDNVVTFSKYQETVRCNQHKRKSC